MPRGDRTGPMGAGPMTGRGAGYCTATAAPGFANFGGGRGRGCGMGFGRGGGLGRGFGRGVGRGWGGPMGAPGEIAAPAPEQQLAALKQQAGAIGAELENIQRRIQELEAKPENT